jgi:transmembrane sensor
MVDQGKDIFLIIAALWNGNATSEEKKVFQQWLNESEENKRFYDTIQRIEPSRMSYKEETKERIFGKLKEIVLPKYVRRTIRFWQYGTVASVALLVVFGAVLLSQRKALSSETAFIETQVPFGMKSKILLSDGTAVYLNSGSYIKYPAKFSGKQRSVVLKGEAYFEVEKDPEHPFIVQTKQLNVKVYGTHFNVKAFDDDRYVETTLLEGSVGIYAKSDLKMKEEVKLVPNQQFVYTIASGEKQVKKVDAPLSTVWREEKYYFENEPLASIVKKLERNFNVPIRITSKELSNELFYGLFTKKRNIYQLLDVLKIHSNFDYTLSNDTICIHKNE